MTIFHPNPKNTVNKCTKSITKIFPCATKVEGYLVEEDARMLWRHVVAVAELCEAQIHVFPYTKRSKSQSFDQQRKDSKSDGAAVESWFCKKLNKCRKIKLDRSQNPDE